MVKRATVALALVWVMSCDLARSADDYVRRLCTSRCAQDTGPCFELCVGGQTFDAGVGGSGGGTSVDAGAADAGGPLPLQVDAGEPTFLVLRLEASDLSLGLVRGYLEERRVRDGGVVAREDLLPRQLVWSGSARFDGAMTRTVDGKAVLLVGYQGELGDGNAVDTTVRRIGRLTRAGSDWSTAIADAFLMNNMSAAVGYDAGFYWAGGSPTVGTQSSIRAVVHGTQGTTYDAGAGPAVRYLALFGGRMYSSGDEPNSGTSVFDWGPAVPGQLLQRPVPLRTSDGGLVGVQNVGGFAFTGAADAVNGVDTLYVSASGVSAGLQKFQRDGGSWNLMWTASAATTLGDPIDCVHVAARRLGSVVSVLCTRGSTNRAIVRFDDDGAGPPTAQLLVRFSDNTAAFRGLAFSPD